MRRLIALAVPLVLAAVTAAHPTAHHDGPVFQALAPVLSRWILVHALQLLLFPLLAIVTVGALAGSRTRLARASRIALATFAVGYTAFDTVAGLGTGIFIAAALEQPLAAHAALGDTIERFWNDPIVGGGRGALGAVGSLAWLVGASAVAACVWREQHARGSAILFGLAALSLTVSHTPPFGPLAMLAVAAALSLLPRDHARVVPMPSSSTAST